MFHAPHAAGTRYVVMPTTGLPTLVQPLPFPVRDHAVERRLLGPRVVQVVVDHVVAERGTRDRSLLETRDRLAQRRREPLDRRLVRIALEGRWRLQLLLDPPEARGDRRREGEIRV